MHRLATLATVLLLFACSGEHLAAPEGTADDPVIPFCDHHEADEFEVPESVEMPGGQVNKADTIVLLHGWALRSKITSRCFDSDGDPIFPCQSGYEPCTINSSGICVGDTHISSFTEARQMLLGRCGKEGAGTEFRACLRPGGRATTPDKTWNYRIRSEDCVQDATRLAQWRTGIRAAMAKAGVNTRHTFNEVTTDTAPLITVRCAQSHEVPVFAPRAAASGVPLHQLTFEFGSPVSVNETCDDSAYGTFGNQVRSLTDRFFSHRSGAIVFNWNVMWDHADGGLSRCAERTQAGFYARAVEYITLHELGHVLGFVHQQWTADPSNIMFAGEGQCSRINQPPSGGFLEPMDEALRLYGADPGSETGTFLSTNLSCLSPI
jgi:hypothetical protein